MMDAKGSSPYPWKWTRVVFLMTAPGAQCSALSIPEAEGGPLGLRAGKRRAWPGSEERNTAVTEGTRWSKSCSPGGDSLTTVPPAAPTSCSTTAWSLSPKTFPQPAESPGTVPPYLLQMQESTFWRRGIDQASLSGTQRLGTSFMPASRF